MLPSFATWFTSFRTVFVFALQPFLPMWVLFRGPKWFLKCLNGDFRGGVFVLKSGLRILIRTPQVPFSTPEITLYQLLDVLNILNIDCPIEIYFRCPEYQFLDVLNIDN